MKLRFKENTYNWGDQFYVYDENYQRRYLVKNHILLWNRKWEICDLDKNVLVVIKKDPKSLLKKKYHIFINDQLVTTITKEHPLLLKYTIENLNWEIRGFMLYEYDILKNGEEVLTFHKESEKWDDRPVLNVIHPSDELLALSVVMTITFIMNASDNDLPTTHV